MLLTDPKVVGAVSWRCMYDTCTVFGGYEISWNYTKGFFQQFFVGHIGEELVVTQSHQCFPFEFRDDFPRDDFIPHFIILERSLLSLGFKMLSDQIFRQDNGHRKARILIKGFYLDIVNVLTDDQCGVARQCPRGGCPCDKSNVFLL